MFRRHHSKGLANKLTVREKERLRVEKAESAARELKKRRNMLIKRPWMASGTYPPNPFHVFVSAKSVAGKRTDLLALSQLYKTLSAQQKQPYVDIGKENADIRHAARAKIAGHNATPYSLFLQAEWKATSAVRLRNKDVTQVVHLSSFAQEASAKWKNMTPTEKEPYVVRASQARATANKNLDDLVLGRKRKKQNSLKRRSKGVGQRSPAGMITTSSRRIFRQRPWATQGTSPNPFSLFIAEKSVKGKVGDFSKLSEQYKALTPEQKQPYMSKAKENMKLRSAAREKYVGYARTAYTTFFQDEWKASSASREGKRFSGEQVVEFAKATAMKWKSMTGEQKAVYAAKALQVRAAAKKHLGEFATAYSKST